MLICFTPICLKIPVKLSVIPIFFFPSPRVIHSENQILILSIISNWNFVWTVVCPIGWAKFVRQHNNPPKSPFLGEYYLETPFLTSSLRIIYLVLVPFVRTYIEDCGHVFMGSNLVVWIWIILVIFIWRCVTWSRAL